MEEQGTICTTVSYLSKVGLKMSDRYELAYFIFFETNESHGIAIKPKGRNAHCP